MAAARAVKVQQSGVVGATTQSTGQRTVVVSGDLIVLDQSNNVVIVYPKGTWTSVTAGPT